MRGFSLVSPTAILDPNPQNHTVYNEPLLLHGFALPLPLRPIMPSHVEFPSDEESASVVVARAMETDADRFHHSFFQGEGYINSSASCSSAALAYDKMHSERVRAASASFVGYDYWLSCQNGAEKGLDPILRYFYNRRVLQSAAQSSASAASGFDSQPVSVSE